MVASASDPSGCEGVEEVRGRAAVVTEGNCSFYERALVAQTAGAGLLVVVANSSNLADLVSIPYSLSRLSHSLLVWEWDRGD